MPPSIAPWERWTARCGFVAEGAVYLLVGGLALLAVGDPRVRPQGARGALDTLARVPLGSVMLLALVAGLGAFVAWKLIQVAVDPEHRHERHRPRRLWARAGYLCSAILHSALAGSAAWRLFMVRQPADNGRAQAQWTQWAMQQPLGRWAVAAVGVGIVLFGLFQVWRAMRPAFAKRLGMTHGECRRAIIAIGRVGVFARGAVFALLGVLLASAAWRYDARTAHGIAGTLDALRQPAYGPWPLAAAAAGLMAYGVLQLARARFH